MNFCFGSKKRKQSYQNDFMTHVNNFIQKVKCHKQSDVTITELIMFKCYLEQDIDPTGVISIPQNEQEIQEMEKHIIWQAVFQKAFPESN